MTLPYERTRSVADARDFLEKLAQDLGLPEPVRIEAKRLLRHYPSLSDIRRVAQIEQYLQSRGEDKSLPLEVALHSTVFSSSTDG